MQGALFYIPYFLVANRACDKDVGSLNGKFVRTPPDGCNLTAVKSVQVSNEIISRCSAGIGLEDIFEGDVERSKLALLESIHASDAWKRVYTTMMEVSGRPSLTAPVSGDTRKMADWGTKIIFAPIEAFLQRCHDMLEVCVVLRRMRDIFVRC